MTKALVWYLFVWCKICSMNIFSNKCTFDFEPSIEMILLLVQIWNVYSDKFSSLCVYKYWNYDIASDIQTYEMKGIADFNTTKKGSFKVFSIHVHVMMCLLNYLLSQTWHSGHIVLIVFGKRT